MRHKNKSEDEVSSIADERVVNAMFESIQQGATIKDIQGIPDSLMEGIYAFAYKFYNEGRLDDAEVFFRFLSIYDFYNSDYIMGLAAVYQLKKSYEKAIELYSLADALSKKKDKQGKRDYKAVFYAGQCNLMLKQGGRAKLCFEIVRDGTGDATLKAKAEGYLKALEHYDNDQGSQTEQLNLKPAE